MGHERERLFRALRKGEKAQKKVKEEEKKPLSDTTRH
jgi:hypothetical protein